MQSLTDFATYLHQRICPEQDESCRRRAASLKSVDYLDIDYDTISQSLVLSAFWHSPRPTRDWHERIDSSQASVKVEVGVLANEKPTHAEEFSLGGFLAVVGEDSKPNPTLFSFPSRHHFASSTSATEYSTAFLEPIGLHPTLRLTLPSSSAPPTEGCALHTYLTLPSSLFLDKYQLSSPNFLASKNLHSIRSLAGETDLEAPIWAISKWGSALLLQLAPPPSTSHPRPIGTFDEPGSSWHADVPLHLRYLPPSQKGQASISVAWPIVFWACPSDDGTKMNTNPFDRVNLGYDGLFGPRTMFYHLQPASGGDTLLEEIQVPVLDLEGSKMKWVEFGTVATIVLGFLWVCLSLLAVNRKSLGRKGGGLKKRD
ncbi:MAG: protease B nonderepressible form [Alectoria fallacina]|uniref:Protein PBN1 n=1 Tax=Alectoria fallacina TaxID=1903189 RepID=A0A8H3F597_9LECA|nr:MAG: protease B nonderepressible form [Alectoria fallacina]